MTNPLTDAQQQYLRSMLALEPSEWGSSGLRIRDSFLRPSAATLPHPGKNEPAVESKALVELVDECLKSFWTAEAPALIEVLRRTSFHMAPELQSIAQRLQKWFLVRDQLLKLVNTMGINSLASNLREMATMSARELANAKSNVTRRQREWLGGGYRRQAKRIKAQYPDIYALDPDWFDEMIAFRK